MSEILSKMYIGVRVKYPLFLSDFNENWIFSTMFRKILKYHIYENLSCESSVVPCGRIDEQTYGQIWRS